MSNGNYHILAFFALTVLYAVVGNFLLGRIAKNFPALWVELGKPTILSTSADKTIRLTSWVLFASWHVSFLPELEKATLMILRLILASLIAILAYMLWQMLTA